MPILDLVLDYDKSKNAKQVAFETCKARHVLFGGSRGGGKTSALVNIIILRLLELPGNRGFLCRKVMRDFRMTTYQTLMKWIPQVIIKRNNEMEKEMTLINGSVLCYGGMDDRQDIERLKGAEFGIIGVDQMEEISDEEFNMLTTTLRLKISDTARPHYQILGTANPAQNWIKARFIDNTVDPDYAFIPSTCKDNAKNLPTDYEQRLRDVYKNRPEMVRAFVDGDWNAQAQENVIIKWNWIEQATKGLNLKKVDGVKRYASVDPAWFGDDMTHIYAFRNNEIIDEDEWGQVDLMESAHKCVTFMVRNNLDCIGVDTIGIGAGLHDKLKELGKHVIPVNVQSQSENPEKFSNLKAQMWWEAGNIFADNNIKIPDDPDLRTQLNTVRYQIVSAGGKVRVEDKVEVKKRLGKSPDKAESLIQGIYLYKFVPFHTGEENRQGWSNRVKADYQTDNMLSGIGKRGCW